MDWPGASGMPAPDRRWGASRWQAVGEGIAGVGTEFEQDNRSVTGVPYLLIQLGVQEPVHRKQGARANTHADKGQQRGLDRQ